MISLIFSLKHAWLMKLAQLRAKLISLLQEGFSSNLEGIFISEIVFNVESSLTMFTFTKSFTGY